MKNKPDPASWGDATKLVRGGLRRSPFGETSEALYLNSGFVYEAPEIAERRFMGEDDGYVYGRYGNPTVTMFEDRLALLEGAEACYALASGMAAVFGALNKRHLAHHDAMAVSAIELGAGFVLITLYMGPFGLLLYVMADKEPKPGTHEEFIKPLWKQSVGSTIHCCAGDATGIVVAAAITALLGLPMWIDLIVEYTAGFLFGLLIFQALFMKDMMGGSYLGAVKMSFLPEWLSMNAMMAGMFPVMVVLMMGRDMRAMEPTQLLYWATMSAGIIVGFFIALPVNAWLVANGLKHGMGSTQSEFPEPVELQTTLIEGLAA